MTREEIMNLDMEGIEARKAAIREEVQAAAEASVLDALDEELNAIEERINQLTVEARKKDMEEVVKGSGTEITKPMEERTMTNMEVRKSLEYANAWANYIKTGDDKECRALLTENVGSGSVPVSTYAEDRVRTAWNREGIMARVRKTYLKGNVKIGFEVSAGDATIHTEASNSAVSEESLVLGVVSLVPQSIKKWINYKVA